MITGLIYSYIFYYNLQFLNHVIFIKTKVLLDAGIGDTDIGDTDIGDAGIGDTGIGDQFWLSCLDHLVLYGPFGFLVPKNSII